MKEPTQHPSPITQHPKPNAQRGGAKLRKGMVHIYTGDGKGKTTAALGLSLRALGWGFRVCFIQFVKGYPDIGEMRIAPTFEGKFEIHQFALDVSRSIDERKVLARREAAEEAMRFAESAVKSGKYDLVVLDEINVAVHYGLIDKERVLALISRKPKGVELVLTGRNAKQEIIEAADYVSVIHKYKHPYDRGVLARKGIDY